MDWIKPQTFEASVLDLLYTPMSGEPISVPKLSFLPDGPQGDKHSGMHTLSTVREARVVPKGSWILNRRQVTLTSQLECEGVARSLDIDEITPVDLQSNLHLEGLPNLSLFPAGTRIHFLDNRRETVGRPILYVTGINPPCEIPRLRIEERIGVEGCATGYERESYGKRGLIAMVYHPGSIKHGDIAQIITPRMANPEEWMPVS